MDAEEMLNAECQMLKYRDLDRGLFSSVSVLQKRGKKTVAFGRGLCHAAQRLKARQHWENRPGNWRFPVKGVN
jgi:hypothetical protein